MRISGKRGGKEKEEGERETDGANYRGGQATGEFFKVSPNFFQFRARLEADVYIRRINGAEIDKVRNGWIGGSMVRQKLLLRGGGEGGINRINDFLQRCVLP